jgi:hypothetical protein
VLQFVQLKYQFFWSIADFSGKQFFKETAVSSLSETLLYLIPKTKQKNISALPRNSPIRQTSPYSASVFEKINF